MVPLAALRQRHDLLRRLRSFFDARGFLEVTTPCLSSETMIDPHIEPWQVPPLRASPGGTCYLQTSPELHMKRLLSAGAGSIYQIGPAFRAGERGPWHQPEFTLAEWYRTGDDMAAGMTLLGDLIADLLDCDRPQTMSYADCFGQFLQLDPLLSTTADLAAVAQRMGEAPRDASRDDLLNWLLSTVIQPQLGWQRPVIIHGFPASQAALARLDPDRPGTAMRFELFYLGVELANGYDELTDAAELERRLQGAQESRHRSGSEALPLPVRFLAAMTDGLPPCTGVALGVDRVLLLAVGGDDLSAVCPFPWGLA